MKKKLLALLLIASIFTQVFPALIFAQDIPGYVFTPTSDGYELSRAESSTAFEITVPDTYNGLPVTSVAPGAFSALTGVYKITLPSSLKSINGSAFEYCASLAQIECSGSYYRSVDGVLYSADGTTLAAYPPAKTGGYTIASACVSVSDYAFFRSFGLTEIALQNVKTIGEYAFYSSSVSSVDLSGVSSVGAYAFSGSALKTVDIPSGISLGEYAFSGCRTLISARAGVLSKYAFAYCTALNEAAVTAGSIPDFAFSGCSSLEYIGIPASVTAIGTGAFYGASLKAVSVGNGVKSVGERAFYGNSGLMLYVPSGSAAIKYAEAEGINSTVNALTTRADGITVGVSNVTLKPGEYYTPNVKVGGTLGTYVLLSSAESKVTVNGTALTAKSVGEAVITAISTDGAYRAEFTVTVSDGEPVLESAHPYTNTFSNIYSYTVSGKPEKISVTFSLATHTEEDKDFIYIYNAKDAFVGAYTGSELAGKTLFIDGDTVKVKLVSDSVNGDYGFKIIKAVSVSALTAVSGITLSATELKLSAGETVKLDAKVVPSDAFPADLVYITSDRNVVTTDENGNLTAIRAGSVKITVCSNYYGVTSCCDVTVSENEYDGMLYTVSGDSATITFYRGSAQELSIPSEINGFAVTSIASGAFAYCLTLKTVNIPASVTSISNGAFAGCTSLTSFTVDSSSKSFAAQNGALYNYYKTTLYACPSGLTGEYTVVDGAVMIRDKAFSCCYGITKINLPSSMQTVSGLAFQYCTSLSELSASGSYLKTENGILYSADMTRLVYYPAAKTGDANVKDGVTKIADFAFVSCADTPRVTLPATVSAISTYAFCYAVTVERIDVASENKTYKSIDGVVYSLDGKTLYLVPNAYSGSLTVAPGTETIAEAALFNCSDITYIGLPDGLLKISDYSFFGAHSLYSLLLPDTVTTVSRPSFTSGLSVYFPPSVSSMTSVNCRAVCRTGSYAAQYCETNGLNYTYGYASYSDNSRILCGNDCKVTIKAADTGSSDIFTGRICSVYSVSASDGYTATDPNACTVVFKTEAEYAYLLTPSGVERLAAVFTDGYLSVSVPYACQIALCSSEIPDASALELRSLPNKTQYSFNEKFAEEGMELYYRDKTGKASVVTSGYTVDCDLSEVGTRRVDVTYMNMTVSFSVTVAESKISGSVKLSGSGAFGTVLTADTSAVAPAGASLSYQWYRAGTVVSSAKSKTYTVTQADIGYALSVRVSGINGYSGTLTSSGITAVKADPGAAQNPKVASKTTDTITLVALDGYEYCLSTDSGYRDSPVFTGLQPGTAYTVYQRIKETATQTASERTYLRVTTNGVYEMTSSVYNINKTNSTLSLVQPQTSVDTLLNGFKEKDYISVYKNGTKITGSEYVGTGCEVRLYNGSTLTQTLKVVITGDVNGDGKITLTDFVQHKNRIQTGKALSTVYEYACDINGDGKVTLTDFVQLKSVIQGTMKLEQNAY